MGDAKCSSSGTIRRKMPPASRQRGLSRTPRPVSTDVYISVTACRQIGDGGHTVSVGYAVLVSACVFAECRVQSVDVANHTKVDSSTKKKKKKKKKKNPSGLIPLL